MRRKSFWNQKECIMILSNPREKCFNLYMKAKSHYGRMNVKDDRLSSLPDELIHKILSFISMRQAIGMSVLSSRWRFIWTTMPYLSFMELDTSLHFSKFVFDVLSHRNNQTHVSSVRLLSRGAFCNESLKRILDYAFSHNLQHLSATFPASNLFIATPAWELPALTTLNLYGITLSDDITDHKRIDIFSKCPNLKNLSVGGFLKSYFIATPTRDLPALTTLRLYGITLCDDNTDKCNGLFSKSPNLKNLSLGGFKVMGTNVLNICHPRLSNLTLEHTYQRLEVVNVVAPQLKNLTIKFCNGKHLISAPGLTSLVMKGFCAPLQLSTQQGFCSLEKVDLCISDPLLEDVHKIGSLLQQLHNVKFLTLNLEILELLSSSLGLISHQPSPFANLKISKFVTSYPATVYLQVGAQEKATMSLLDSSDQSAIFTMVSREEIRVMRNILSARKLNARLRGLLEQRKAPGDSSKAHIRKQIKQKKIELLTMLQLIEGLWTELPASKRLAMQATFSSVCEDAAHSRMIRYNKKPRGLMSIFMNILQHIAAVFL